MPLSSADERIKRELAPMLEYTGGAVVSELLGHDRMKATLIYPRYKVNYDFGAGLVELYDLESDPGEHRDIFGEQEELASQHARRIDAYRTVRSANRVRADSPIPHIGAENTAESKVSG